jgi:hypothetical protein
LISKWLVFCVVVLHRAFQNPNLHIILGMFDFNVISALCNNFKYFQYFVLSKCFCVVTISVWVLCANFFYVFKSYLECLISRWLVFYAIVKSDFNILCFQSVSCNNFECFVQQFWMLSHNVECFVWDFFVFFKPYLECSISKHD